VYTCLTIYKTITSYYVRCFFARAVDATKEANGADDAKYGEFGGKPGGGRSGGYQGGRSRDPRILSGGPGGRHPCPPQHSPGHCSPADQDAETEAKPQN
jgi:hypothetical protein